VGQALAHAMRPARLALAVSAAMLAIVGGGAGAGGGTAAWLPNPPCPRVCDRGRTALCLRVHAPAAAGSTARAPVWRVSGAACLCAAGSGQDDGEQRAPGASTWTVRRRGGQVRRVERPSPSSEYSSADAKQRPLGQAEGRGRGGQERRGRGAGGGSSRRQKSPARQFPFGVQLRALGDLTAALDLQRSALEKEALGPEDAGTQRDARSADTIEILAEIATASAKRGMCGTADLEEILARAKACHVPLRRPLFFSLLKTAAILVSRNRAKRDLIDTLLAEMQAHSLAADQATTSVLVELVTSTADRGHARAEDVWWVLENVGMEALSLRVWMPLMKVLAAAAKRGHASSSDAMALAERARDYFGRRGMCPSVFFFNSAMLVLVNEQRHRAGGVPPGMRVRQGVQAASVSAQGRVTAAPRQGGPDVSPWEILAFMDEVGELPDEVTFNSALSFYVPSCVGDTRDEARRQALALMSEMRRRNVAASTATYNTVLQVLAFSSLDGAAPDEALSHIFSSPPAARQDDPRRHNRLLSALMLVDEMMIRMRKIGITPDSMTYDTLFNVAIAACKISVVVKGDDVQRWLAGMLAEGAQGSHRTWQSVTNLMPLLGAGGQITGPQAADIMEQLEHLAAAPSVQSYNMILTTMARAGRHGLGSLSDAGRVRKAMQKSEIAMNCYTFNALFDVLAADAGWPQSEVQLTDCQDLTHRLARQHVSPDTVTLNSALGVLVLLARRNPPRASAPDAEALIRMFEDRFSVAANALTFTKLLEIVAADAGHGNAELADAQRILEQMRRKGIEPSRISWNVVMTLVARSAALEPAAMANADQVLEQMNAAGFAPDSFTVAAYCNCARRTKIEGEQRGESLAGAASRQGKGEGNAGWDDDADERHARRRSGSDAEAMRSLVDALHLGADTWYDEDQAGGFGADYMGEDEEDLYGLECRYLESYAYISSSETPSDGEEHADGEGDMVDLRAGADLANTYEDGGLGADSSARASKVVGGCERDAEEAREESEDADREEGLRGWSANGFKSIRGYFDYTYVPEEDWEEGDEEEEVAVLRAKGSALGPGQEAKNLRDLRETYVLKAW
jgi:hypothetical protein